MAERLIEISPPTAEGRRLWTKALELAQAFGKEKNWTLVGGLMVQLYGFERGSEARPTADIDILGDSRARPATTQTIAETLVERGAEPTLPPVSDEDLGYKFEIDGEIVEVLGSEGIKGNPKTYGKHTTFKVPGGTQALRRAETVMVSLDGAEPVALRRPSLLGAILIKVAWRRPAKDKFESDRQDLLRLLAFVERPRAMAAELKGREKKWLKDVAGHLDFEEARLTGVLGQREVTLAEQTYRLLTA